MNRGGFFGLIGATFVAPFLPRKAEQKPIFIGQNSLPEQIQLMQLPPANWLGQESGNLWISPYQNVTCKPWYNT